MATEQPERRPYPDADLPLDVLELSTGALYVYDAGRDTDCWIESDWHIALERAR